MEPALLLNATYEPIRVIPWQKAITLMLLGKAEVLEQHDDAMVRSAQDAHEVPAVLRLIRRVRVPRKPVQFSRTNIYRRDGYECQYCAGTFGPSDLTFDHVLPRSRGGDTSWTNIVTCCQPCNRRKGNRTPDEAAMPLLRPAREPNWRPFSAGPDQHEPPEIWRPYLWC